MSNKYFPTLPQYIDDIPKKAHINNYNEISEKIEKSNHRYFLSRISNSNKQSPKIFKHHKGFNHQEIGLIPLQTINLDRFIITNKYLNQEMLNFITLDKTRQYKMMRKKKSFITLTKRVKMDYCRKQAAFNTTLTGSKTNFFDSQTKRKHQFIKPKWKYNFSQSLQKNKKMQYTPWQYQQDIE